MSKMLIKESQCTHCGICNAVCPMKIINKPDKNSFPYIEDSKLNLCIQCGHCEVYCPTGAISFEDRCAKIPIPENSGNISSEDIGYYMCKRRSVRHFKNEIIPKEDIMNILNIARYAPSAGNGQPVEWLVVHDPAKVKKIAGITIEWMKTLVNSNHPMSAYVPVLKEAWDKGNDVICRNAPHLLIAVIPENNMPAQTDAVIALTQFEIAAQAFNIGTCWAGFVSMASWYYEPMKIELNMETGKKAGYVMMFGYPVYKVYAIPQRKTQHISWL